MPKMAKKLTEEAKAVAISEIMLEVRRMIVNVKVKAKRKWEGGNWKKLREEVEAKALAMREKEEKEDKKNLVVLKNVFAGSGADKDLIV